MSDEKKSEAEKYRETVIRALETHYREEIQRQNDEPVEVDQLNNYEDGYREGLKDGLNAAYGVVAELPWPGPPLKHIKTEKRVLGTCGVDSGQIIMVDPCYVEDGLNYDACCNVDDGPACGGVKMSSGLGDGGYEVIGTYGTLEFWGERLFSAEIVFISDVEDEKDEQEEK